MKYDQVAIQNAERRAFEVLTERKSIVMADAQIAARMSCKEGDAVEVPNKYYVNPINVSNPATLVQETAWVNTGQQLSFDFTINGPNPSATLNNIPLGKNNVFVIFGIQILFGEGANANNRIYRSFGNTPNDDSLYNSIVQMKMEQSTLLDKVDGRNFRDVPSVLTEAHPDDGLLLIQPLRIVTGELGFFSVFINLINPISALVITSNMFVSMRLRGAFGQASA